MLKWYHPASIDSDSLELAENGEYSLSVEQVEVRWKYTLWKDGAIIKTRTSFVTANQAKRRCEFALGDSISGKKVSRRTKFDIDSYGGCDQGNGVN